MNTTGINAAIAVLAIVVTLYAIRNNEVKILPDLFAFVWAFTAPKPHYAIGMVIILAVVRHSTISHALVALVPEWLVPLLLPGASYVSIADAEAAAAEKAFQERVEQEETPPENIETPQRVAEKAEAIMIAAKTEYAARAVLSGVMGLTEATRLAAGVQSGRRYTLWSRRIKLEMSNQQNHFNPLDADKKTVIIKPP